MKYARSKRFLREYDALPDACKALARAAGRALSDYLDDRANDPSAKPPEELRLKKVKGREGIMEITWSFARPDGRMTFSLIRDTETDERMVFWRRCGGHDIFKDP